MEARISVMVLDESICALHGDLGNSAVFVEDVEEIPLGYFFSVKVACFRCKYMLVDRR